MQNTVPSLVGLLQHTKNLKALHARPFDSTVFGPIEPVLSGELLPQNVAKTNSGLPGSKGF